MRREPIRSVGDTVVEFVHKGRSSLDRLLRFQRRTLGRVTLCLDLCVWRLLLTVLAGGGFFRRNRGCLRRVLYIVDSKSIRLQGVNRMQDVGKVVQHLDHYAILDTDY